MSRPPARSTLFPYTTLFRSLSVIEVHEAVRLVAHALEEEERARVGLQHHGILPSGQEDALGPAADLARRRVALDALLGEADDLEVREAELGEHRARRAQLAEAAVDHEQVRQPAALARVAEAPAQHLGHRREVVRALDGADAVAAGAVLVGRPLVEGDDGAHGLAALEGRDVEALDALGRVGEVEARL